MNYEEKLREIINSKYYNSEDKAVFAKYFPKLKENEDERMSKEIINFLRLPHRQFVGKRDHEKWIAWLEKQKDYIKLPNSAYTSNKDVIEFADKYSHDVWEKLMDNFKKIENYHIGCNDVSDIVLNAIINTYNWLEKQGNKSVNIDIESMVSSYEQRVVSQYNGVRNNPLVNMCLTAFRHGVENALEELNLKKLEKQGEPKNKEKVLIGTRKDVALSIMNFLDRNTLGMCLSNMECADLESAVIDSDWSKVYDYMKKKLEKQGDNKECGDEWEVSTGLYKCTKRMFDGTPEGRLLFEVGNLYKCVRIHKCVTKNNVAVFESSDGQCVFLIDPVVREHFIKV